MIAVFTRSERDFKELRFHPANNFKRIRSLDDLMGMRFTGVIEAYNFWHDKKVEEAYERLKLRQPELFDKTK